MTLKIFIPIFNLDYLFNVIENKKVSMTLNHIILVFFFFFDSSFFQI